ncbi:ABC transporter permease [Herpetosiphon giganteus]|uniref:ABC transporter permease n=1 Tax=Herpetosiphon giganteus TaxID=2029754 RepID=UPI001957EA55|nr:ABC transporter permease [Herpetosiphon giganteus]MBM7844904.1 ABC-2 type transport system permease protein [Herpetosiphon giganteus]
MSKIWTIARHEYLTHLRRRGFLISTFGMPIMLVLLFVVVVVVLLLSSQVKAIGYVDQSGLTAGLKPEIAWRSNLGDVQIRQYASLDEAKTALQAESIDAAFVVPSDFLAKGTIEGYALEALPQLAESQFSAFLKAVLAAQLREEPDVVFQPIRKLDSIVLDAPPAEARRSGLSIAVPIFFGILLLGSTFGSGSYLMMALIEEKEQRIMEILASSLSTYQIMTGKILGLGALALTQLSIWASGGLVLLGFAAAQFDLIGEQGISIGVIVLAFMLFFPSYFIIAATLSAIGAAVTSAQQGQQLTGIVTLLCTMPLWFIAVLSNNPNGGLALGFNIFPYTAPITLLQRVMSGSVPVWQQIATVLWLWLMAALITRFAGRVVRIGLLRYRQSLRIRDLFQLGKL